MFMTLKANAYSAELRDTPGTVKRYARVTDFTTNRDIARGWILEGKPVLAAIVDGSQSYPTRYNRIVPAALGPRGGLAGVAWGIDAT